MKRENLPNSASLHLSLIPARMNSEFRIFLACHLPAVTAQSSSKEGSRRVVTLNESEECSILFPCFESDHVLWHLKDIPCLETSLVLFNMEFPKVIYLAMEPLFLRGSSRASLPGLVGLICMPCILIYKI